MKRRPKNKPDPGPDPRDDGMVSMRYMELLDGMPGNRGSKDGEKITMFTVVCGDSIETFAFSIKDSKSLVARLIVSLADAGSPLANELFHAHFESGYPNEDMDSGGEKGAVR